HTDDATSWIGALTAWLAAFPVYRSYAEDGHPAAADLAHWEEASRCARLSLGPDEDARLNQMQRWMHASAAPDGRRAIERLQQITPALAAKSLEDTLHYRHGVLLSRNEVGTWPQQFALGLQRFHCRNLQ